MYFVVDNWAVTSWSVITVTGSFRRQDGWLFSIQSIMQDECSDLFFCSWGHCLFCFDLLIVLLLASLGWYVCKRMISLSLHETSSIIGCLIFCNHCTRWTDAYTVIMIILPELTFLFALFCFSVWLVKIHFAVKILALISEWVALFLSWKVMLWFQMKNCSFSGFIFILKIRHE